MSDIRLAATVIVARDPFEVYLTRRSARSAFAPDAFVFPGGTVDDPDRSPEVQARTLGLSPQRLTEEFRAEISPALSSSEPAIEAAAARALLVTALRELFEEAGLLFVCDADGAPIARDRIDWELVDSERAALRSGERYFADFLGAHDFYADARALTLFSHWITPPSEPHRYNTHFFFAIAPAHQAARADRHETHDGVWISPAHALARHRAGEMHLVYPTIKHLERLANFDSAEHVRTYARSKAVLTIMPAVGTGDFRIPAALEDAW